MTDILTDLSEPALRTAIKANFYAVFASLERSPTVDFARQPGLIRWRTPIMHPLFQGVLITEARPGGEEQLIRESREYFVAHDIPEFC
jgi:hypothetical protein